nr:hypothetical membrane protein [uncultured archaeon]
MKFRIVRKMWLLCFLLFVFIFILSFPLIVEIFNLQSVLPHPLNTFGPHFAFFRDFSEFSPQPDKYVSQMSSLIGNAIALMTLILTLVGIFVVILAISVGDFRDYFLNAISICSNNEKVEIKDELKGDIKKLLANYEDSQERLSFFYLIFISYSLIIFLILTSFVFYFEYEYMLEILWRIIVIYSLSLIILIAAAVYYSTRAADYTLLSRIQKEAASQILDIAIADDKDISSENITNLSKSLNTTIKNVKSMMYKLSNMLSAKELAVSGVFGAIALFVAFILGSAILMATGIPASGGLANMFAAIFIAVIGFKIVDKFGAATVFFTVMGILAIPSPIMGPPGVHKVGVMFLMGLIFDIVLFIFKRKNVGYLIGAAITGVDGAIFIYMLLVLLGLPGADLLRPMLIPFSIIYAILGLVGAYTGLLIYEKRIQQLSVVQNLKSKK